MKHLGFFTSFTVLLIAQILIWTYCNFSQLITVTILPMLILMISIRRGPIFTMMVAFVTGFIVDFLAGGMLGLTSLALVPVGLVRNYVVKLTYGQELMSREEEISIHKYGWLKLYIACTIVSLLFLIVYVWADGAGMRPFTFNASKVVLSLLTSVILSMCAAPLLCHEDNSRWM